MLHGRRLFTVAHRVGLPGIELAGTGSISMVSRTEKFWVSDAVQPWQHGVRVSPVMFTTVPPVCTLAEGRDSRGHSGTFPGDSQRTLVCRRPLLRASRWHSPVGHGYRIASQRGMWAGGTEV